MRKIYNITFGSGKTYLKFLIAWTGEPQLRNSLKMLETFSNLHNLRVDIKIFVGFDNREVHQLIYDEVGKCKSPSIKLDGDMHLENFDSLINLIDCLNDNTVCIAPVYCYVLKRNIYGVHVFGRHVKNLKAGDDVFPDKYETISSEILDLKRDSFVSHCKRPSRSQIDNFIAHRLRKFIYSKCTRIDYLHFILRAMLMHRSSLLRIFPIIKTSLSTTYKQIDTSKLQAEIECILGDFGYDV